MRRRFQSSGIHHLILTLKGRGNIGHGYTGTGKQCRINRYINRATLHAEQFHFGHILHVQQLVLDSLGLILQLTIGMRFAAQSVEYAQHIAKIIVHHRRSGSSRQLGLHISHFPPQLIPKLLHLVGTDFLLYIYRDFRQTGPVIRFQIIQFTQ